MHVLTIIIYRVQYYIKYGWDQCLVDPDKGIHSQRKLAAAQQPRSVSFELLHSLPSADDPQWTKRLYKIPKITFSTIYDRKVLLKRVSYLESVGQ